MSLFEFPNPVNEKAARTVAAVVAAVSLIALLTGWQWIAIPLAYGFVARALTGPTLSPLGLFATRVAAPRLGEPRYVPGPPKRFAQGIGAVCTVAAAIAGPLLGWTLVTDVLLAMMVAFATLESALGLCVGCRVFALLMRAGVIPPSTCEECADIWSRPRERGAAA